MQKAKATWVIASSMESRGPRYMENIPSNLSILFLGYGICVFLGWSMCRPLRTEPIDPIRVACYPVLGFALLLVFCSYLRIPSLPFSKTVPALLAVICLVAGGIEWLRFHLLGRDYCASLTRAWRPAVLIFVGVTCLASPLLFRLCVKNFSDPGTWGYDVGNYVLTTREYVDNGMLLPGDAEGSESNPFVAFIRYQSILGSSILSGEPSKNPADLLGPTAAFSASRNVSLMPRNAGAAVDAFFAVILDLRPIPAYFLSVLLCTILLIHAAVALAFRVGLRGGIAVIFTAVAVYWPTVVRPVMFDNRDQAICLFLVVALLAVCRAGAGAWPIRSILLAALCLTYIEIAPFAVVAYALCAAGRSPTRIWLRSLLLEGGVALGLCLVFSPGLASYLLHQATAAEASATMTGLAAPFWIFENLAGVYAGVDPGKNSYHWFLLTLSGIVFLALVVIGVIRSGIARQWGFVVAIGCFVAADLVFMSGSRDYAAYKLGTVTFPLLLVALGVTLRNPEGSPNRTVDRGLWLLGRPCVAVLMFAILCGVWMRAGVYVKDVPFREGLNAILWDRKEHTMLAGLAPRSNDVTELASIVEEIGNRNSVVVGATRADVGYVQGYANPDHTFLLNGRVFNTAIALNDQPYDSIRFLNGGTPIENIFLTNSNRVAKRAYHRKDSVVPLGEAPEAFDAFRTFSRIRIDPAKPFPFAALQFTELAASPQAGDLFPDGFAFGPAGINFGIFALNASAAPRTVQVTVRALNKAAEEILPVLVSYFFVEMNKVDLSGIAPRFENGVLRCTIPLSEDPAGSLISIRFTQERIDYDMISLIPTRTATDDRLPVFWIGDFLINPLR